MGLIVTGPRLLQSMLYHLRSQLPKTRTAVKKDCSARMLPSWSAGELAAGVLLSNSWGAVK